MTQVTFPKEITGRTADTTYSDDNTPGTGMADGGHQELWMPLMQDVVSAASHTATKAAIAEESATAAKASAQTSTQNRSEAETAALAARLYSEIAATIASANITLNDKTISNDQTIPANKNGLSVGPIKIARDVTVKITHGATWRIIGPDRA